MGEHCSRSAAQAASLGCGLGVSQGHQHNFGLLRDFSPILYFPLPQQRHWLMSMRVLMCEFARTRVSLLMHARTGTYSPILKRRRNEGPTGGCYRELSFRIVRSLSPEAELASSPPACQQSCQASDSVTFYKIAVFFLQSHLRENWEQEAHCLSGLHQELCSPSS